MKLLHLGDLHLGRSLADFDLKEDQEYLLDQLLKIIDERSVDGVLIAGDVYDKSIPSEAATKMLDYFLSQLAQRKVSTYMISGNHDSDERLNFGSNLFESNRIYISSKYNGTLYKQTLRVGEEEADIYLLPFVKASQVRHFLPDAEIESYDDAVKAIIEHAKIDTARCNVLVAHQFVGGANEETCFGGSESIGTQSVGLVEMISYESFRDFDYVALGHIHSPQQVGRKEVRYSGSPLKYSVSEANNEKSVPLITIENGKPEIELIPIKPLRNLRHIKGKMKDLLARENVTDPQDYIYATLTDDESINDVMGIFQQIYPNTVKIDYDNERTREIEHVDITQITKEKSFEQLIGDFYQQIYGYEISDEEMEIMRDVAREAGVIHETN